MIPSVVQLVEPIIKMLKSAQNVKAFNTVTELAKDFTGIVIRNFVKSLGKVV